MSSKYSPIGAEEAAEFLAREHTTQQMERKRQDENLDQLHSSIQRIGHMSLGISNELDSQNQMLDELEQETDTTTDVLNAVTKKTREYVKKSGGMKYFCIILLLSVILFVLTYLVIMT